MTEAKKGAREGVKAKLPTAEELERRRRLERQNAQRTFKPNLKTIPWKK